MRKGEVDVVDNSSALVSSEKLVCLKLEGMILFQTEEAATLWIVKKGKQLTSEIF
jgi:hypothetical protein